MCLGNAGMIEQAAVQFTRTCLLNNDAIRTLTPIAVEGHIVY